MTIRFYVAEDALAVAEALLMLQSVDFVEIHDVNEVERSIDAYVDAHLYANIKPNYFEIGVVLGEQGAAKHVCYHKEI